MLRSSYFFITAILSTVPCWGQADLAKKAAPTAVSLMRALPGVYRIETQGEGRIRVPNSVRINWSKLAADAESAQTASEDNKKLSKAFHQWNVLAKAPEKYLEASQEASEYTYSTKNGSGFAVSREGVVLTNRHVVEEFDNAPLSASDMLSSAETQANVLMDSLLDGISDDGIEPLIHRESLKSVLNWYGLQSRKWFRRKTVYVMVAYADTGMEPVDFAKEAAKQLGIPAEWGTPVFVPAKVIGMGGADASQDVAILRIEQNVQDALICLPLASLNEVKENDAIISLGFPAFRYEKGKTNKLQWSQVNLEKGKIDSLPRHGEPEFRELSTLHPKGLKLSDRSMVAVTALIRPGSSGGPVVLENGSVVGLNVYFRVVQQQEQPKFNLPSRTISLKPTPTSVNAVVPIDFAERLLAKYNITPKIGETNELWEEGLSLFEAGNKLAAKEKFQEVAKRQKLLLIEKPYARTIPPINITSHYVKEMIERCEHRAK